MVTGSAGALLRGWRVRRRCSQIELALAVGVSPPHLSFVETNGTDAGGRLVARVTQTQALLAR